MKLSGLVPMTCLLLTCGCVSLFGPQFQSSVYVPGTDTAVAAAKESMSTSNAVALLQKYILQYVDTKKAKKGTGEMFMGPLQGWGKPTVTTNGYTYFEPTSSALIGNKFSMNMVIVNMKFADVEKVDIVHRIAGETKTPAKIVLYNTKNEVVLECPVVGSESFVPRILAAVEILCPQIRPAPAAPEKK